MLSSTSTGSWAVNSGSWQHWPLRNPAHFSSPGMSGSAFPLAFFVARRRCRRARQGTKAQVNYRTTAEIPPNSPTGFFRAASPKSTARLRSAKRYPCCTDRARTARGSRRRSRSRNPGRMARGRARRRCFCRRHCYPRPDAKALEERALPALARLGLKISVALAGAGGRGRPR